MTAQNSANKSVFYKFLPYYLNKVKYLRPQLIMSVIFSVLSYPALMLIINILCPVERELIELSQYISDPTPEQYEMNQGLIRGTMYPGLDLPFKGMVNKTPLPQSALAELQELGFAVQELALYLDTHRDDTEALALYRRYQRTYHDKRMEYSETYGPLSHMEPITAAEYNWLNEPWPWEYCANKEG